SRTPYGSRPTRDAARSRSSTAASSRRPAFPARAPPAGGRARAPARRTRARPCRLRLSALPKRERRLVLDVLDANTLGPPEEDRVGVRRINDVVDLDTEVVCRSDVLVRRVDEN